MLDLRKAGPGLTSAPQITLASTIVRKHIAEQTQVKAFKFISAALHEPPKLDGGSRARARMAC